MHQSLTSETAIPTQQTLSSVPSKFILDHDDLVLEKSINSGGCGEVYLGEYSPTHEKVAIKRLFSIEMSKKNADLFAREVQINAIVSHTFLVPFVGFTLTYPFTIVTKYIPNGSLFDALHRSDEYLDPTDNNHKSASTNKKIIKLTPTDRSKIAYAVASGMNYLHESGIMHRDLKSPNVLLDENLLPKICDFGLSRTQRLASSMTKAVGTPQWMAPELINAKVYDESVDVYSYGVVLWEMVTEDVPYEGMDSYQIIYALSVAMNDKSDINQKNQRQEQTPKSDKNPKSSKSQHQSKNKSKKSDKNTESNSTTNTNSLMKYFPIPSDTPKQLIDLIKDCLSIDPKKRPTFSEVMNRIEKGAIFEGTDLTQFSSFLQIYGSKTPVPPTYSARKAHTDPTFLAQHKQNSIEILTPINIDANTNDTSSNKFFNYGIYKTTTTTTSDNNYNYNDNKSNCNPHRTLTSSQRADVSRNLEQLKNGTPNQVQASLEYFEVNQDYLYTEEIPFWDTILYVLIHCQPKLEDRIHNLAISCAKVEILLQRIRFIRDLSIYVDSKTLDVLLYAVSVIPDVITDSFISKLQFLSIRKDSNARLKSIILLCRIYTIVPAFKKQIISFFYAIAERFVNVESGHLILLQLFQDSNNNNNNKTLNDSIIKLIQLFYSSQIDENICAAYQCNLSLKKPNLQPLLVSIQPIIKHLELSETVSDLSLDYLRFFVNFKDCSIELIEAILKCYLKYGNEKASLLLCLFSKLTKGEPFLKDPLLSLFLQSKQKKAVSLFRILLIIIKYNTNYINEMSLFIKNNLLVLNFIAEVLRYGDLSTFSGVAWMFIQIHIDHAFVDRIDQLTILNLFSQKFKDVKNPVALKLGAAAFAKFAEFKFSPSFTTVVQTLLKNLPTLDNIDCTESSNPSDSASSSSSDCIKALSVFALHKELKGMFTLYKISELLKPFQNQSDLRDYIIKIENSIM